MPWHDGKDFLFFSYMRELRYMHQAIDDNDQSKLRMRVFFKVCTFFETEKRLADLYFHRDFEIYLWKKTQKNIFKNFYAICNLSHIIITATRGWDVFLLVDFFFSSYIRRVQYVHLYVHACNFNIFFDELLFERIVSTYMCTILLLYIL